MADEQFYLRYYVGHKVRLHAVRRGTAAAHAASAQKQL